MLSALPDEKLLGRTVATWKASTSKDQEVRICSWFFAKFIHIDETLPSPSLPTKVISFSVIKLEQKLNLNFQADNLVIDRTPPRVVQEGVKLRHNDCRFNLMQGLRLTIPRIGQTVKVSRCMKVLIIWVYRWSVLDQSFNNRNVDVQELQNCGELRVESKILSHTVWSI